jgi:adenine-specific DNA-methyltransferase
MPASANLIPRARKSAGTAGGSNRRQIRKAHGIHYTPPLLAKYLAESIVSRLIDVRDQPRDLAVLDPACGDGELLRAIFSALPASWRTRVVLAGRDKDEQALSKAKATLKNLQARSVDLEAGDFLQLAPVLTQGQGELNLFDSKPTRDQRLLAQFDVVISNPPYVRTQILGSSAAQDLAARFELTGRVDLYHAFVKAMTLALRPGGILGLLTSNRFLTVQSGTTIRDWLNKQFDLLRIVDLGDTRLFEAAVLPAIVIARRLNGVRKANECEFIRIYESQDGNAPSAVANSLFERLDGSFSGGFRVNGTSFNVESGRLQTSADSRKPWSISNQAVDSWLATVERHSVATFADVAKICVGIKTTADNVFVRDDWESLPFEERPEDDFLHPLITHHIAGRWHLPAALETTKRVLYPYVASADAREPIDLEKFPRTRRYLLRFREQLESRTYVMNSGRQWFELWVPHRPKDWTECKIAFPDISESTKFFLVEPAWIVNGDCYWAKLLPGKDKSWLYLMLAVANSSFCLKFYDTVFHNKLYAGRRRFMSQYVSRFPLPDIARCGEILRLIPQVLDEASEQRDDLAQVEQQIDQLVWTAFGLREEINR